MVDTPRGRLGVPVADQMLADMPAVNTNVRIKIGGRVVAFAAMPSPEEIDHVAQQLGVQPAAQAPPGPLPSQVNLTGSQTVPGAAAGPSIGQQLRQHAPMIGQVLGGLSPVPGGGFLGGVAGSAIQRGGMPTMSDVGTAAAGEALAFLPGAGRLARSAATRFLGPTATKAAERFGIPISVPEAMRGTMSERILPWLARNPVTSRLIGRAGQAQSEAVGRAATGIGERFGGALPRLEFGAAARRSIQQTIRATTPEKGTALRELASRVADEQLTKAGFAEALAKDPIKLAAVMKQTGEGGMNDLRRAWWTSVLESATAKQGTRKGMISPKAIVKAWDSLGGRGADEAGTLAAQVSLFGRRRKLMSDFVDSLRPLQAADVAGSRVHVPYRWHYEILGTVAGLASGYGGHYGETAIAAEIAAPWLAAHALVNGPPGVVGQILAPIGPSLTRAGVQEGFPGNQ